MRRRLLHSLTQAFTKELASARRWLPLVPFLLRVVARPVRGFRVCIPYVFRFFVLLGSITECCSASYHYRVLGAPQVTDPGRDRLRVMLGELLDHMQGADEVGNSTAQEYPEYTAMAEAVHSATE